MVLVVQINIEKSKCIYLKELSFYNHNFYMLPNEINGCSVLKEIYDEVWGTYLYHLGVLKNNVFVGQCHYDSIGTRVECEQMFIFELL